MKVTSLKATNFKGRTFEHSLGPITIFHGPNSSGKSARLEALRLALAGFVPGVSSKPGDIAQAFGGLDSMAVGVRLEDVKFALTGNPAIPEVIVKKGAGVIRSYKRKPRGGIDYTCADDGLPDGWAVQPVAVDVQEYLGLPEKQRVRVLFKLAKLNREVNASTVVAELKNIKLESNSEATETFLASLCASVESKYRTAMTDGQPVQEWIVDLVEYFRKFHLSSKQNVDRMNLTVQGISQLRAAQPPSPGSIQEVERRLAAARTEETRLTTDLGRIEGELNGAKRQEQTLYNLGSELSGHLADRTKEIEEAKNRMALIQSKHGQKPDVEPVRRRQKEVVEQGQSIKREIDGLELQIQTENRKHSDRMAQRFCPYCKSKKPDWKSVIEAEYSILISDLTEKLDAKRKQRQPLADECRALDQQLSAADQTLIVWKARQDEINDLTVTIHNLEILMARRADAIKQRDSIQVTDSTALEKQHRETLAALQGVQAARSSLDTDRIRLSAERTEALQKIQAADQAQNALNEVAILKEALAKIETLCEQLVSESIKPLIDKVNTLCGIILPASVEFRDNQIGWREHGVWISNPIQMGGARRTLLFAALSVALTELGGIVVLDEFRNLDRDNRKQVLSHFDELIHQGVIGQVVLADPDVADIRNVASPAITFIEVQ